MGEVFDARWQDAASAAGGAQEGGAEAVVEGGEEEEGEEEEGGEAEEEEEGGGEEGHDEGFEEDGEEPWGGLWVDLFMLLDYWRHGMGLRKGGIFWNWMDLGFRGRGKLDRRSRSAKDVREFEEFEVCFGWGWKEGKTESGGGAVVHRFTITFVFLKHYNLHIYDWVAQNSKFE